MGESLKFINQKLARRPTTNPPQPNTPLRQMPNSTRGIPIGDSLVQQDRSKTVRGISSLT